MTSQIQVFSDNYSGTSYEKTLQCISLYENKLDNLKFKNKYVMHKQWSINNGSSSRYDIRNHPYNDDWTNYITMYEWDLGGYLGYHTFINDFSGYKFGIILISAAYGYGDTSSTPNIVIIPGAIETSNGDPVSSSSASSASDVPSLQIYTINYDRFVHKICAGPKQLNVSDLFRVYTYEGQNISLISAYVLGRTMIFTTMRRLDNPSITTNAIIMTGCILDCHNYDGCNSTLESYDCATGISDIISYIDVFTDNVRYPNTYFTNIHQMSYNFDKCIMNKFTHNGYYSDNIFTYDGRIPSKHFFYNGEEYINIGFNLVIKLS